jgi:hypothetical protein
VRAAGVDPAHVQRFLPAAIRRLFPAHGFELASIPCYDFRTEARKALTRSRHERKIIAISTPQSGLALSHRVIGSISGGSFVNIHSNNRGLFRLLRESLSRRNFQ